MSQKNQTFAFIVGEVAPAFYGRLDLQKYPLGLALAENVIVDYRGGLLNRAGSEFIAMLPQQVHRFVRFRTKDDDLVLLFTAGKMRILKDGKFVHAGAPASGTIAAGVITVFNTAVVGQLVYVSGAAVKGYFQVTAKAGSTITIVSPIGQVVPDGAVTVSQAYELTTTFTESELPNLKFAQDLSRLVCTIDTRLPVFITRTTDISWVVTTFSNVLPTAPTSLVGVASGAGSASVSFAVTAVVNGVESGVSTELVSSNIVNYSTTTGHYTLSWAAVAGAQRYNVYRSLVYPTAYPAGAQLGYLGYTTGLSFVDRNITADYTKTVPESINFFANNNFPAVYARFQQRGVYGGLAKDPLTVVGSIGEDKDRFSISFPPIATDSYSYTLDSESERPIKHMLPLRYGLMLFTDDGITQLRGGDNSAISATNAVAEPQGFVSVSDLDPLAINLDVLFMTALNSELNQMVYTEYSNSFKMQDILALSSHLFGTGKAATRMAWASEPHKLLSFVREDGQRVSLTYERNLEVYGWTRNLTRGNYLDIVIVRENAYNLAYQTVRRMIKDISVMFIEREKPRYDAGYNKMWFVDAGVERPLIKPAFEIVITRAMNETDAYFMDAEWKLVASDITWAVVDQILYAKEGMFRVASLEDGYVALAPMSSPSVSTFYSKNKLRVAPGDWGYNVITNSIEGLWWLEGETVSVLHDGDATLDLTVTSGSVSIINASAYMTVGIPYVSRIQTLPLSLRDYVLGGFSMTVRGMSMRQFNTRGLSVGHDFLSMEELPSRRNENWGNPLNAFTELTVHEMWGSSGWDVETDLCFEQRYPLPFNLLGFTFDLDVGE